MIQKKKYTIGIDLGGTKVAVGWVDHQGHLQDKVKIPLNLDSCSTVKDKKKRVIQTMVEACVELKKRYGQEIVTDCLGIGLASAGPLNVQKEILIYPANFKGFGVFAIVKRLTFELKKYGIDLPIAFQNDAMAAALGEKWVGKASGLKTFVLITVGTGIGTGVILNHEPCQNQGMGSEFGHLLIHLEHLKQERNFAYSVKNFTVEGMASGSGLIRQARSKFNIEVTQVEDLIARYPHEASLLFKEASLALGVLFYNLSLGFNLEKILVGGGMVAIQERFLPQAVEIYQGLIRARNASFECPVELASLGPDAGIIGAAYQVRKNFS